jgi:hypothetical protein
LPVRGIDNKNGGKMAEWYVTYERARVFAAGEVQLVVQCRARERDPGWLAGWRVVLVLLLRGGPWLFPPDRKR